MTSLAGVHEATCGLRSTREVGRLIAQNDVPISDETIALVYVIAALIMVLVGIVVIAWLASLVARLQDWRSGDRERRG